MYNKILKTNNLNIITIISKYCLEIIIMSVTVNDNKY